MWLSRIRRKSHIPSLYHIPSTSPICMVQILALKREIRIAFSRNGSIRLFKWNRNVIWNQCIRTCLDISTMPLHTFPLSLRRSVFSPSPTRSASFSLATSITTAAVWRNRRGSSPNVKATSGSHARATMKIKSAKDMFGVGEKAKSTPLHTALTSILSALLTCKRIAGRTSRSGKKIHDRERQTVILTLPGLSHSAHA